MAESTRPRTRQRGTARRGKTEEDPLEEYAFTSTVLDTVGALIVVLDHRGRIVRFNRACEKLTGYTSEEVKGRAFWDLLLVPGEVREVQKVFRQLISGRFPSQHENYWLTKNGERRRIAWSNTVLSGSRGSVTHVIGTGLDITERRRAEQELQLQSEITRNLSEGVALVRAKDSTIVYANQRYEEMFGYGPGELSGKNIAELNAPGETNPEVISRAIRMRLNRDGRWNGDVLNVKKDGTPFWTRASVSTFDHPEYGKVWVGTQSNIDAEKQAELALKEREETIAALLESAAQAVLAIDERGRVVLANAMAESMFGYSREELLDQPVEMLLPERLRKTHKTHRKSFFSRPTQRPMGAGLGLAGRRKDGAEFPIEVGLSSIQNKQGTLAVSFITEITQRKRAEDEIRKRAHQLRLVADNVPALVAHVGADQRYQFVNKQYEVFFGLPQDQIVGMRVDELLGPEAYQLVRQHIETALSGHGSSYELRLPLKGAGLRWIEVTYVPEFDSRGEAQGFFALIHDITESKCVAHELRESQRQMSTLIGNLPGAAYRCLNQEDYPVEFISDGIHRLTGYSASDFMDSRISYANLIYPEDRDRIWEEIQEALRRRQAFQLTYRITTAGGKKKWVWEQGQGIFSSTGEAEALEGFVTDVTQHKRAEEQIRKREKELALLAANVPALFSYVAADQRYRFVNNQYEKLYNLSQAEIVGKSVKELLGKQAYKAAKEHIEAVLSGRQVSYEAAFSLKPAGVRWMEVTYMPDFNSEGRVVGFFTLVHDVTERKQSQLELENSREELRALSAQLITAQEEERRRIARDLHDDINQKLAVISMSLAQLKNTPPPKREELRTELGELQRSLEQLSDDVRNVCRELHPSVLEHAGLVAALRASCADFSRREAIRAHFEVKGKSETFPQPLTVCLYRVAQEALHNAARHSGSPEVRVELSSTEQQVRLRVRDRGVGFNPAEIKAGVGLGLTSMEERVRLLGGEFALQSQPGSGTTIDVRVPLSSAKKSAAQGGAG